MSDLAGTTLHERYFLREKVGAGGMADVYLAWDNMRSTRMAVKVLRRDLAQDPRFYQMFAKEAELLRQLEHPNIVRLYEFGSQDEIAFIIMDWVEGSNLHQTITERKVPLGLDEVAWVLDGICPALGFAHQNNVFHCDIKPANIMLHVDGRVLLTDFGVARLAQDQALGGTPTYMAPEQFAEDNEVSVRTDIYSLGITLYEMLSGGKLPFRGETASSQGSTVRDRIAWEHRNLPPPPLNNHNPNMPSAIQQVIEKALSKNVQQRYGSALELRQAFEQARQVVGSRGVHCPNQISQSPGVPPIPKPSIGQTIGQIKLPSISLPKPPSLPRNIPSLQPSPRAGRGPYLLGRSGEFSGQRLLIPSQGLTFGRSKKNHIQIRDSNVSRTHASVLRTRRGVYIRDENSSVGTFINGQRISPATPVQLRDGDVIYIGYSQVFEYKEK
jgi:serine/threonine protein kinase